MDVGILAGNLAAWLSEDALPLWRERGFDAASGGFAETIDLGGDPTRDDRRGRVPPRQIYCFAQAGLNGWHGDWQAPAEGGMAYFDRVFLQPTGFYASLASADGEMLDPEFDLYIQAFALLGYASLGNVVPARRAEMSERSEALRARLNAWCKHPAGGFHEDKSERVPLRANPHMHLFEACLASETVEGFNASAWGALADEIARLCMTRFIDPGSGVLREFFDRDWTPFPGPKGRSVEPGHLFEWCWLLLIWAERRGNREAFSRARRLFEIAETHGVCPDRNVAMMGLRDDFSVADPVARLWPQTEWLKSAVRLAMVSRGSERMGYMASALRAGSALERFLDTPLRGLWRDKMLPDGRFVEEAAPASSLYHIVCATYELQDCLRRLQAPLSAA